jgi:glycosyltransferase involved in cell wall biosynthesis
MQNIKVSVVVPIYNVELYLRRCLDSLIGQSLKEIEIICINDKSPDDSSHIVDEYIKRDSRVSLVTNAENKGLGLSRNEGLIRSQGEYVAFVDSDDYIESNMFESMYDIATKRHLDVLDSNYIVELSDGKTIAKEIVPNKDCYSIDEIYKIIESYLTHSDDCFNISSCTKLYRNEYLKKNKIQFQSERLILFEDLFFNTNVMLACPQLGSVNLYGYHYCIRGNSLIQSYKQEAYNRSVKLHEAFRQTLEREGKLQQFIKPLNIGFVRTHFLCLNNELKSKSNFIKKLKNCISIINDVKAKEIYSKVSIADLPKSPNVLTMLMRYAVAILVKTL